MKSDGYTFEIVQRCGDGFGQVLARRSDAKQLLMPICTCDDVSDEALIALAQDWMNAGAVL